MTEIENLISNYQPTEKTRELIAKTKIAALIGIAGAGKNSIMNMLLSDPEYVQVVSHTTRAPRTNNGRMETNDVDYHFIDFAKAEEMLRNHEFVEAKFVHGTIYGTSVAEYEKAFSQNKIAINDIDIQGIHEFRSISQTVKAIFVTPPSFGIWRERLFLRYGENGPSADELAKRTESAIRELTDALSHNYFHFVINDDLQRAAKVTNEIIHGDDSFGYKDEFARIIAGKLLDDIVTHQKPC